MKAPAWFIKAVRSVLMWTEGGEDIDPIAEKLWVVLEPHMADLTVRGEAKDINEYAGDSPR